MVIQKSRVQFSRAKFTGLLPALILTVFALGLFALTPALYADSGSARISAIDDFFLNLVGVSIGDTRQEFEKRYSNSFKSTTVSVYDGADEELLTRLIEEGHLHPSYRGLNKRLRALEQQGRDLPTTVWCSDDCPPSLKEQDVKLLSLDISPDGVIYRISVRIGFSRFTSRERKISQVVTQFGKPDAGDSDSTSPSGALLARPWLHFNLVRETQADDLVGPVRIDDFAGKRDLYFLENRGQLRVFEGRVMSAKYDKERDSVRLYLGRVTPTDNFDPAALFAVGIAGVDWRPILQESYIRDGTLQCWLDDESAYIKAMKLPEALPVRIRGTVAEPVGNNSLAIESCSIGGYVPGIGEVEGYSREEEYYQAAKDLLPEVPPAYSGVGSTDYYESWMLTNIHIEPVRGNWVEHTWTDVAALSIE